MAGGGPARGRGGTQFPGACRGVRTPLGLAAAAPLLSASQTTMLGAPSRVEATPRLKPDPPCLSVFPQPSVPREGCGGRHPSSGRSSRRSPPVPSAWSRSLPNGRPKSEGARREPGGGDAGSVRRTADRPAHRCVQRLGLRHGSSGLRPCGSGDGGGGGQGQSEAGARAVGSSAGPWGPSGDRGRAGVC